MVIHDGITFGSGWYERGPGKSDAPRLHQGLRAAGHEPLRRPRPGGETIIAHAPDPDLVGKHVSQALGPNSYPTGSAVAASADQDGAWFDYTYANPASDIVETKHS